MSDVRSRTVGCDVGTMFFQTAEMDDKNSISYKTIRNAFVELPESEDTQDILINNNWKWVKDGDKFYVIGEDSIKVANMFPNVELRRPLQDGVLNKGEEKKMVVLSEIISSTIGKAPDNNSVVCTCVSSPSIDGSQDSDFHKVRLQGMFKRLGWQTKVIEEALAVVLSERPTMKESDGTESAYSGVGISFGAGRVNALLAYKGLKAIGMSAARCLHKNTLVQTQRGLIEINKIDANQDVVFDSLGNSQEINSVNITGVKEKLLSINVEGLPAFPIFCTKDHRILAIRRGQEEWVEAGQLEKSDQLFEPVIKFSGQQSLYLGMDLDKDKRIHLKKSKNLGRFIGMFLGDGSTSLYKKSGGYVQLAFDKNSNMVNEYANICSSLFDRDVNVNKPEKDNTIRLKIHNLGLASYLKNNYYVGGEKCLPLPLSEISNNMAIGILQGLIDSDGNMNKTGGFTFCNTSLQVIWLAHSLLNRLGIKHNICKRKPRTGGVNSKGIQICGKKESYVITVGSFGANLFNNYVMHDSSYDNILPERICRSVCSVVETDYNDEVFDLMVDSPEHSFMVSGGIVHNSGDWVDKKAAEATDTPLSIITRLKETKLDLSNPDFDDERIYALYTYYESMMEYIIQNFAKKFMEVKNQFEAPLDIIIAGGTSTPKGFCAKFDELIRGLSLPFQVKSVRHAADPRNSVVKGCLTQALITSKKLAKAANSEDLKEILGE